ncbi:MAG: xanthine dehydrogenase family protein molybdopterin-binding subunit [Candidatus Eisenbacteria bacterium]|nr:xanthine dehydrogenase family protein molybdopterin-binding subunit [Candidatus Eisenbacteria bacterium]
MTTPRITRREFLETTALAGAGLAIGVRLADAAPARATAALQADVWLRVGADGLVTVTVARSELGQGVRTALPMLVAEELEADWKDVRIEPAIAAAKYGDMTTGGSMSIRSLWTPLRRAGAAARAMLVGAAAQSWGVERATCRAESGTVVHVPSGRRLAYGALVARAAQLPVPEDPPLKDPKTFRLLGTRVARLDVPAKLDGSAVFGLDVRLPGMLFASVARCPVPGGKAADFDPAPALAVPGVRRVDRCGSGVAVLAENTWAAFKGREALKVSWDEGALATLDSGAIRRAFEEKAKQVGLPARKEGQGAAALAGCARTIEAVYEVPYLAHAALEPVNCTARVTADACEVWAPTQSASDALEWAARTAEMKPEAVTVHTTLVGGGFGRRLMQDYVAQAVMLAKAAGVPVQVVWTREDDTRHDFYRPATYNLLRAGLDANGSPVAWTHRIVGPSILGQLVPEMRGGLDRSSVMGAADLPYAIPNLEVDWVLHDPGVPVGWWRSVGSSQNAFVTECFVDEVAAAGGHDPLAFRRALLRDQPRHLAVLNLAAEKAGWGAPLPPRRGRGLAVHGSFGSFVAMVAEVAVADDGAVKVERVVCAVDCGMVVHPGLVEAQMESAVAFGLSAALHGEITIEQGAVVQSGFDDYPVLRLDEMPAVEVHLAPSGDAVGGIGEPGVPPVAPAVVNAIAAATGKRVRRLPVRAEEVRKG